MHLAGVCSVLPTPFHAGGEVDLDSLARVTEYAVTSGVQAVTVLGATGEAVRLCDRERAAVIETVASAVNGRADVVAGTSTDGVRTCIEASREARRLGATAIMIYPPRALKLSSESVVNHYKAVAEAIDLPIVIQDDPPMCGFAMEAGLLVRIAREIPAARTIKLDEQPTPFKTARILAAAGDLRLHVIGGSGGLFLIEELMAGSAGIMSGFTHPAMLVEVLRLFRTGAIDQAASLFYQMLPLLRFEFQDMLGIAIRKEVFRRRGVIADASTRAPGAVLDEGTRAALDRLLAWTAQQDGLGAWMR